MLKSGIINPQINSLLSRVRHTNTIVIADRGFPSWPGIETIDVSVVDDIPRIPDILRALLSNWTCGRIWMAKEFQEHNSPHTIATLTGLTGSIPIEWEPHIAFKTRVPFAIGLIRTGDTTQYANMILESA
jgi:D-ribose pyranase